MKKTEVILAGVAVLALLFAGSLLFLNYAGNSSKTTTTTTTILKENLENDLSAPRENDEGGVSFVVRYLNPSQGYNDVLAFEVKMDVHEDYKLEDVSYLRLKSGNSLKAISWEGPRGHHGTGILKFPKFDSSGNPFIEDSMGNFELVILDVGGMKERVFRW